MYAYPQHEKTDVKPQAHAGRFKGYLKKKRRKHVFGASPWSRRWFVIHRDTLKWYKNKRSSHLSGFINFHEVLSIHLLKTSSAPPHKDTASGGGGASSSVQSDDEADFDENDNDENDDDDDASDDGDGQFVSPDGKLVFSFGA
jgi:hypothetical protein